jgi:hypothetical protein
LLSLSYVLGMAATTAAGARPPLAGGQVQAMLKP